jgi:hypothetical protein
VLLIISIPLGCIGQDSTGDSSMVSSNNTDASINDEITNLEINYSEIELLPAYNESKPKWLKTNASNIARIALKDSRVQQLIQEGGTIIGVTYSCHPTYEGYEGLGCAPALKIKSKSENKIVDFLVDEEKEIVAETVTEITSSN